MSPLKGSEDGGTTVTINGKRFDNVAQVYFGDTPAESFTVVNAKEIQAVTPEGFGKVDVQVASYSGGFSPITTADKFKYKA